MMRKEEIFIEQYSYGEVEFEEGEHGEGTYFILIENLEQMLLDSTEEDYRKDYIKNFKFSTFNIVYTDEKIIVIPIIRKDLEFSVALWSQIDQGLIKTISKENVIWLTDGEDLKVLLKLENVRD